MTKKLTLAAVAMLLLTGGMNAQNASRLIGRSVWKWSGSQWNFDDSANYHYSPGKGGGLEELSAEALAYDSSMQVVLYQGNYLPYRKSIQTLNNSNVLQRLMTENNLTTFINYRLYDYTYNGNNMRLSDTLKNWNTGNNQWVNQVRRTRTFDGNNNLLSLVIENWDVNNSQWMNVSAFYYAYNGNNQTDEKSLVWDGGLSQWDSAGWRHYDWNTNNQWDTITNYVYSGTWTPTSQIYFLYDGNNNNTEQWSRVWNSTLNQYETNMNWQMDYDGNNYKTTDTAYYWDDVNNAWYTSTQNNYWYDGNGNLAKWIVMEYDTANAVYRNISYDTMAYNSFNQGTYTRRLSWNTGTNDWGQTNDREYYYYYELYTASAAHLAKNAGELKLFPSPAMGSVNVDVKWNEPQDFTISIYDMQGRQLRQWSEKATSQYRKNIPLAGMAAGTYLLQVRSKDATTQGRFVILQ